MSNTTETASARIVNAIASRHPLLYLVSWEEERVQSMLQEVSANHYQDNRPIVQWTITRGFYTVQESINDLTDPEEALGYIMENENGAIYLMKDMPALFDSNHSLIRKLRDVYHHMTNRNSTIIMSYPLLTIPEEIKREVMLIELELPSGEEIFNYLKRISKSMDLDEKIPKNWLFLCSDAMRGMSLNEVRHLYHDLVHDELIGSELALHEIHKVKGQILLKQSCLRVINDKFNLDYIGGLDRVKSWVNTRKTLFSIKARQAGIPLPSGVLFMGISGCGKSLAAKTIASSWGLQLVRMDMNLIMSGAYGTPEIAFERATRVAELIAPVVLWIDEIENSFGYDDDTITGGNVNIFASFLTWMQEKPSTVFLVATANRIARLPAEMIRKGRFDEVFFLDLPHADERQEIFRIHVIKNQGNAEKFNLGAMARLTQGWTGAEIEQAVNSARVRAFTEDKEFSDSQVMQSIGQTVPLSETMHEQLNQLRKWSFNRATPASSRARSATS